VTGQALTAVIGSRKLAGADWQLAVERPIERAEQFSPCDTPDGWIAVLGIRRELKLRVTRQAHREMAQHGSGAPGYARCMSTEPRRPQAAPATAAGKPTLDGIEDKWMQRWAKEHVVQV
jgi:hypothetical protein